MSGISWRTSMTADSGGSGLDYRTPNPDTRALRATNFSDVSGNAAS